MEGRQLLAAGLSASLVADIVPGADSSNPEHLVNADGTLFFGVWDPSRYPGPTRSLWASDGTAAGTRFVTAKAVPSNEVVPVGRSVFFTTGEVRLWASDGTDAGTVPLGPYADGQDPGPYNLTAVGGRLFYAWRTPGIGKELWVSDGTPAGTTLVKDIYPGTRLDWVTFYDEFGNSYRVRMEVTNQSQPSSLTSFHGAVYFAATDEQHGRELWKSDGTAAGTTLVKNISPDGKSSKKVQSSNPSGLAVVNGALYFGAAGGLWRSDGTEAGTVLVKQIAATDQPIYVNGIAGVNGTVYFSANDGTRGAELWKSDGTAAGTMLVKDIRPGAGGSAPRSLSDANGTLVFLADDGVHGLEPWRSDGTAAGTVLLKDIYPGSTGLTSNYAFASLLTNVNGRLYFPADDGVHGMELWQTDGTAAGTVMVQDINPNTGPASGLGSWPQYLTAMNSTLYFAADDGVHGTELWDPPAVEAPRAPVPASHPAARPSTEATRSRATPTLGGVGDPAIAPVAEPLPAPWVWELANGPRRRRKPQ